MGTRNNQAHTAGQILYGSVNHSDPSTQNEIPGAQPAQNISYPSAGGNMEGEPISPLRRTFCLIVLFDLIITVILWLIFTEVKADGDSLKAFKDQVIEYKFKSSLFDTVMLSAFRFVALILPYALLRSNLPWWVAITTFITCVMMICKCILYSYDKTIPGLEILDYILLLAAVVLSWVETWFMDLKVLPQERKERDRIAAAQRAAQEYSENSPLLSRFLRPARTEESYYSPQHSDDDSLRDSDDDNKSFHSAIAGRNHSRSQSITSSTSQTTHYKSMIEQAQSEAIELLESENWKTEAGVDEIEGIVYTKTTKTYGKVFKLVAEMDIDALTLFRDLVDNAEAMPQWNPTVLECKTLEHVDDNTDISYNIAAEGAGGMVSCRDFVYIRHWEQNNGRYITCSVSVEHPSMPPQSKYVRGVQGPTLIRLIDIENNRLKWEWLLNTNLKGWLPQYLIDQALSGVLLAYLANLRKHADELKPALPV